MKFAAVWMMVLAQSAAASGTSMVGEFEGRGLACYGTLSIKANVLSWDTQALKCATASYKMLKHDSSASGQSYILQIDDAKSCGFGAITLESDRKDPAQWTAVGYQSVDDMHNAKLPAYQRLECSMRKRPARN